MLEYLKSVRMAVRLIYVLVISLAFTEAIKRLFIVSDNFAIPNWEKTTLFLIFFSFITRFFIGAYRVMTYDIEIEIRRPKIIIDSIGFFIQAISFYIFALIYQNLIYTEWLILIICAIDSIWLVLLAAFWKIMDDTFSEYILHNIVFIAFILISINLDYNNIYALITISAIAFIIDFWYNRETYFAIKKSPGLRIFIAGPYGDNKSKAEIDKNVEEARRIGKEIALKGHFPFIPHTMLHGWEMDARFNVEHFKNIDFKWLEFCDALFFIGESPGANVEKERATKKGLQIFESLDKIPTVSN